MSSLGFVDFRSFCRESWNDKNVVVGIINNLKTANHIITANGLFNRIDWSSGYEDVLTWHTRNEKKAKIIIEAFKEVFSDMSEKDQEEIRSFIKANQIFIGAKIPKFDFKKSTIAYLESSDLIKKFNQFFNVVSKKIIASYSHCTIEKKTHKEAVAILTCNAGGGHRMVAQAVEKCLQEKYRTKIINVDELEGDFISMVTSGAVKTHQIFSQFQCQENDLQKADLYRDMRWELHHFIPNRVMDELNRAILKMGASIILNTIHHEVDYFSTNADLDIPMAFINTDYELPPQLLEMKKNIKTKNLKIFTPVDYQLSIEGILPIGYPVRSGFEQIASKDQKEAINQKYHIQDDEWLVVMQMGSLAMGIESHLQELLKETKKMDKKCHFVFLCSNNQAVKNAVNDANRTKVNTRVILHAEGVLNDTELSILYQMSDAVLGKPGGATTAEIAVTNAFLLAYHPLPWERPNLNYLENRNQAVEIKSFDALNYWLKNKKIPAMDKQKKILSWKEQLLNEVEQMEANKKLEEPVFVKKPYSVNKFSNLFTRYIRRALSSARTSLEFFLFALKFMWNSGRRGLSFDRLKNWWKYQ